MRAFASFSAAGGRNPVDDRAISRGRRRAAGRMAAFAVSVAALIPSGPAAAQYLIYERPYVYERPPVYAPPPRGQLEYVMLPRAEVRRRLQAMGYWQISRPELRGRAYVLTAVDNEGPVSLRIDAYSGEVLGARPLPALPPGAGRPPLVPPAPVGTPQPRVVTPAAPLPPSRPKEADQAPPPVAQVPAQVPAPTSVQGAVGAPESAPKGAVPAAEAAPAAAPTVTIGHAEQAPAQNTPQAPAPVPSVGEPTTAGSATPGDSSAGSASVLSQPAGTQ